MSTVRRTLFVALLINLGKGFARRIAIPRAPALPQSRPWRTDGLCTAPRAGEPRRLAQPSTDQSGVTRALTPFARHCLAAPVLGLALLGGLHSASALEEDEQQPLYLEADNAVLDEQKAESVYTGNVFVQQGSMQIHADQVTVHHREDRQPEHIIAVGKPATYRQEVEGEKQPVQAEAMRMEYDTAKDEITLIDHAVVYQGADTFRNDRIVYDRANAQVRAGSNVQGKERVKILIHPAQR
jgi:lipopolysaccharide export system protein LptA